MSHPVLWSLQTDNQAPSRARELLGTHLVREHPQLAAETMDTALLLVTELVTNAVRHGGDPVHVQVTDQPEHVRVDVMDGGSGVPVRLSGVDPWAESGRGLLLVDLLANGWGTGPGCQPGAGKSVWFELAPLSGSSRRSAC